VKRGECGAVSGRGGDARAVRVRACGGVDGCAVGCPRKKLGRAHAAVRGEGGGGLGRPEAKARRGGRPVAGPGRRRQPKRGGGGSGPVTDHTGRAERKEVGPKSLLGLKSKEVKEKSIFN
jgi:hypothetical protein